MSFSRRGSVVYAYDQMDDFRYLLNQGKLCSAMSAMPCRWVMRAIVRALVLSMPYQSNMSSDASAVRASDAYVTSGMKRNRCAPLISVIRHAVKFELLSSGVVNP